MRPPGPVPRTLRSSTPSLRAKRRVDGAAGIGLWPFPSESAGMSSAATDLAGAMAVVAVRAGSVLADLEGAAGGAAAFAGAGAAALLAAVVRIWRTVWPTRSLSPGLTATDSTRPACGQGTSITAFSVSSSSTG